MTLYVGLMSGTSLDAIDLSIVDISVSGAQYAIRLVGATETAIPASLRESIWSLCHPSFDQLTLLADLEQLWVRIAAKGVAQLLALTQTKSSDIRAIGSHGQTLRHLPNLGFTFQMGNPSLLAELTSIDVVADFRRRDMAAGGQGAPLVPMFHRDAFPNIPRPYAVLNLGGVANLTCVTDNDDDLFGFDCGPANGLMDEWIMRHQSKNYDASGAWAAEGHCDDRLLASLLTHEFFSHPPPKSTGRDHFNLKWVDSVLINDDLIHISPRNVQATLAELTAITCAEALKKHLPQCRQLLVCGGGADNTFLMERLSRLLQPVPVRKTDEAGLPAKAIESMAFAWLAHRFMEKLPGNHPKVTGADGYRVLGGWYPA